MEFGVNVTIDSRGLDAIAGAMGSAAGSSPTGPIRDMYTQWGRRAEAFNRRRFDINSKGGGDWAPLALSTIRARMGANKSGSAKRAGARFGGGARIDGDGGLGRGARSSLARDTHRGQIVAFPGGFFKSSPLVPAGRTVSILRDTGILMNALTIGQPGSTFTMITGGVLYGVDGSARHPAVASFLAKVGASPSAKKPGKFTAAGRKVAAGKRSGSVTIADIAAFHQIGGPYLPQRKVVDVPDPPTLDAMAGDAVNAVRKLGETGTATAFGGTV